MRGTSLEIITLVLSIGPTLGRSVDVAARDTEKVSSADVPKFLKEKDMNDTTPPVHNVMDSKTLEYSHNAVKGESPVPVLAVAAAHHLFPYKVLTVFKSISEQPSLVLPPNLAAFVLENVNNAESRYHLFSPIVELFVNQSLVSANCIALLGRLYTDPYCKDGYILVADQLKGIEELAHRKMPDLKNEDLRKRFFNFRKIFKRVTKKKPKKRREIIVIRRGDGGNWDGNGNVSTEVKKADEPGVEKKDDGAKESAKKADDKGADNNNTEKEQTMVGKEPTEAKEEIQEKDGTSLDPDAQKPAESEADGGDASGSESPVTE